MVLDERLAEYLLIGCAVDKDLRAVDDGFIMQGLAFGVLHIAETPQGGPVRRPTFDGRVDVPGYDVSARHAETDGAGPIGRAVQRRAIGRVRGRGGEEVGISRSGQDLEEKALIEHRGVLADLSSLRHQSVGLVISGIRCVPGYGLGPSVVQYRKADPGKCANFHIFAHRPAGKIWCRFIVRVDFFSTGRGVIKLHAAAQAIFHHLVLLLICSQGLGKDARREGCPG